MRRERVQYGLQRTLEGKEREDEEREGGRRGGEEVAEELLYWRDKEGSAREEENGVDFERKIQKLKKRAGKCPPRNNRVQEENRGG